jgi:YHS domain-containing protein
VIRTLVYVFYVVFWLMVVRVVLRAIARLFGGGGRPATAGRPGGRSAARPAEDLVRDRVCNTHVPRSRALVANIDGHEEYFCSPACRDRAREAVARVS